MKTRVELFKAQMEATTRQVMRITGHSEEYLGKHLFENGYAWLEFIGCDEYGFQNLPHTKEFWGFWKKEWHTMNQHFIYAAERNLIYGDMKTWYEKYHEFTEDNRYLNSTLINAAYHQLVKELAVKR